MIGRPPMRAQWLVVMLVVPVAAAAAQAFYFTTGWPAGPAGPRTLTQNHPGSSLGDPPVPGPTGHAIIPNTTTGDTPLNGPQPPASGSVPTPEPASTTPQPASPTPEPATVVLAGLGLAVLAAARRRR